MRLTTMTDYAMRLLMYVGRHPDRLCTISEIAQAYQVSEPHLMKITHRLAQQGWIETVRGKNGGMRLSRPPDQISIGAVVRDTENDMDLVECFTTGGNCTLSGQCGLTGIVSGALQKFLAHLDHYTLADLLEPVSNCHSGSALGPGEHVVTLVRQPPQAKPH
ncbi:MAG TPA: Rrf2 family transcriptional regulator [Candidimonas sp.]|nr:Rrf2 family transcriptional regulator [Candidimonas sp.]